MQLLKSSCRVCLIVSFGGLTSWYCLLVILRASITLCFSIDDDDDDDDDEEKGNDGVCHPPHYKRCCIKPSRGRENEREQNGEFIENVSYFYFS